MEENTRFEKAITRNLYELAHALMELKTLAAFENYIAKNDIYVCGESFFNISNRALFNDMISHTIKVLDFDERGDSFTFWDILKNDKARKETLKAYSKEKIDFLNRLVPKLKIIRDKTHFHIDRKSVLNPQKIWEEANIQGKEIEEALQYLFYILNELHHAVFGRNFLYQPEDYNGEDLIKLLDFAGSSDLVDVVPKIE